MVLDCQLGEDGQRPKSRPSGKHVRRERRKFVGFSEHLKLARAKKETKTGPDAWLTRKFAVFLVAGIYCYAYYVFVVQLCVKMVRMEDDRLGNRTQGIIYLVIFHAMFCMFNWSYWKAVTTAPGFACDYVPKTDPPLEQAELVVDESQRFENLPQSPRHSQIMEALEAPLAVAREGEPSLEAATARPPSPEPTDFSTLNAVLPHPSIPGHSPTSDTFGTRTERFSTEGETAISSPSTSTFPLTYPPRARTNKDSNATSPTRVSRDSGKRSFLHFPAPPEDWEPAGPKLLVDRIPPQVPVLTEGYRYDVNEGILRPYRSHKCRHCDAVVLKMDHHCPWVGGCVGARNYKFFYNFLQYSSLYTLFVTISLIIANTLPLRSPSRPHPSLDGQQIAIIALAGLFAVFTSALLAAHTRLILLNMTTIEEMGMNRMSARERAALDRTYGFWGFRGKKMTRERWDADWGRLGREGNLWWLGSGRANWEVTMGKAKLGWFLPIPAKPVHDDGLSYVPNPRFSKEGLWRMRKEWPKELR